MIRFRFLVPALLLTTPSLAQQIAQPPTVTESQMVNNGITATMQFLSGLKGSLDQKDAKIAAYEDAFNKVGQVKPGEAGQTLSWTGKEWQWVSPPKAPEAPKAEKKD